MKLAKRCSVTVAWFPTPFLWDRELLGANAGDTVAAIAARLGVAGRGRTMVDGVLVPIDEREACVVQAGSVVAVERVARGVVQGAQGIYSAVSSLVSVVNGLRSGLGGSAAALSYVNVAIGIQGLSLLRDSLIPDIDIHDTDGGPSSRTTVVNDRNRLDRYGTVPQLLGASRCYPRLSAASYTEVRGVKLFVRMRLTCGVGPITFSDPRIGDQPLFDPGTTIDHATRMTGDGPFDHVEIEFRKGTATDADTTIYTNGVEEQAVGLDLNNRADWITRRTPADVTEISVDVVWPVGLRHQKANGAFELTRVWVHVQYRDASDSSAAWKSVKRINHAANRTDAHYVSRKWAVAKGQYDVRMRRYDNFGSAGTTDRTMWATLRTVTPSDGEDVENLSRIEILAQLTDRLPDLIDTFNVYGQLSVPYWNGSAWVTGATSQCAAAFRHVLQGGANLEPLADTFLDLDELEAWAEETDDLGLYYNRWITNASNALDVLREIAAAGRAGVTEVDGKFSVVRDTAQSAPAAWFTPVNFANVTMTRELREPIHALKVTWTDPDSDYLDVQDTVYADGYSKTGTEPGMTEATEFESVRFRGVTSWEQAYKLGRYHLAALRLRPRHWEGETDWEHYPVKLGDWVRLSHDVPLLGLAAGLVKAVTLDGSGNCASVTLDEEITMESGKDYAIEFRDADGGWARISADLVTSVGDSTVVTFDPAIPAANPHPAVDDIYCFGLEDNVAIDCVVTRVSEGPEKSARIALRDLAPAVLTAHEGTIPAFTSRITIPPALTPGAPAGPSAGRPRVEGGRASGSSGAGRLRNRRIRISLARSAARAVNTGAQRQRGG